MALRIPSLPDRGRVLVVALLVVLATPWATGVPSAGAATPAAVGHGADPSAVGDDPVGQWPLRPTPEVVRRFDPPESTWGPGHRGVDLLGSVGAAVHAALPGTVTYAGVLAGRGVVVVDHGATRTTYEPVAASVGVGDSVAAGAVLGRLEIVQSHCFPRACLHWGWIRNADDVYLDPLRLVGGPAPVRLLPLWRSTPVSSGVAPVHGRWLSATGLGF
ncbi:M23 family metallopeptidase [Nocardioides sp. KR10-350]|uniref:murein hydrolase activator EnvC family protein n=1 Tax=Nocardioides cheoyonin TaxID=3156615 RepID=UPI0032B43482